MLGLYTPRSIRVPSRRRERTAIVGIAALLLIVGAVVGYIQRQRDAEPPPRIHRLPSITYSQSGNQQGALNRLAGRIMAALAALDRVIFQHAYTPPAGKRVSSTAH